MCVVVDSLQRDVGSLGGLAAFAPSLCQTCHYRAVLLPQPYNLDIYNRICENSEGVKELTLAFIHFS